MDMPASAPAIGPPIDKEALKRKYAEERDKRIRPDGAAQYVRLESEFADLAADPYTPVTPRTRPKSATTAAGSARLSGSTTRPCSIPR
jgi:hypothetical protein